MMMTLKVERQRTLAVKGEIQNVCGDARKLSELLKDIEPDVRLMYVLEEC